MPYFFSQKPWIIGERECAIGWPQTKAFCHCQPSMAPELAQFLQQRQQRQADDGEIVALDLLEELDALALDLVGADAEFSAMAPTRARCRPMKAGSSLRIVSLATPTCRHSVSPLRASTAALFS